MPHKLEELDFLPPLSKLKDIDFHKIVEDFKIQQEGKKLNQYKLPRIVFLGNFKYLSLTDQRYLCAALGFECFDNLVSLVSETNNNEVDKTGSLLNMWRDIKKDFTKLIVIGDAATENIKNTLYRKYQKADNPIITQYKIPVIMESELIKTHPDYPKINKSTLWKVVILKV